MIAKVVHFLVEIPSIRILALRDLVSKPDHVVHSTTRGEIRERARALFAASCALSHTVLARRDSQPSLTLPATGWIFRPSGIDTFKPRKM